MIHRLTWLILLILAAGCGSASDTGVYFRINGYQESGAAYLAVHLFRSDTSDGTLQEVTLDSPVVRAPLSTDGYRVLVTLSDSQSGTWYSLAVVTMDDMGRVLTLDMSQPVQVQSGHIRGVDMTAQTQVADSLVLPSGSILLPRDPGCLAMPWDLDCDGYPAADSPSVKQAPAAIRALPGDCDDTDREVNPARVDSSMESDMDCTMVTERWCWTYEPVTGTCHYGGVDDSGGCPVSDASSTLASGDFCEAWNSTGAVYEEPYAVLCYVPEGSEVQIIPADIHVQAYDSDNTGCEAMVVGMHDMSAKFGGQYGELSWGECDSPLTVRPDGDGWGMATIVYLVSGQASSLSASKVLVVPRPGMPQCMIVDVVPFYSDMPE